MTSARPEPPLTPDGRYIAARERFWRDAAADFHRPLARSCRCGDWQAALWAEP